MRAVVVPGRRDSILTGSFSHACTASARAGAGSKLKESTAVHAQYARTAAETGSVARHGMPSSKPSRRGRRGRRGRASATAAAAGGALAPISLTSIAFSPAAADLRTALTTVLPRSVRESGGRRGVRAGGLARGCVFTHTGLMTRACHVRAVPGDIPRVGDRRSAGRLKPELTVVHRTLTLAHT